MVSKESASNYIDLFEKFKNGILNVDPVFFCEKNLVVNGNSLTLKTGYKPFADIYRYIGLKAISKDSKPIVLVKGRQVGATTMAAALECYFAGCGIYGKNGNSSMRMMHLFPTLALAAAYTKDKLDPMIGQSRPVPGTIKKNGLPKSFMENLLDGSNQSNDSMYFKRFNHSNQIWIESTGLDGDRIRGRSIDLCFFDECQDMPDLAIGAATKVLTKSNFGKTGEGVQVYFGTPKRKGGTYWKMWQNSSQNYFHLHCEKCEKYFPLYRPDVNWRDIWIYGLTVKCTNCGHEQDKLQAQERGKWIPLNNPEHCSFVGYHINMLYIPDFTRETINGMMPENSPTNTERIYMNEVLGEFFDGEGGTISASEIKEKCIDHDRRMKKQISYQDKRVYAGFDWGQRAALEMASGKNLGGGRSYSCAVILTVEGNLFNIEFATRLDKPDPDYKEHVVDEMFRRYNLSRAVGDIGDAYDLTHRLQKAYDEKFLASRSSHKVIGRVKYSDQEWPKTIIFEKDYYISEILGLLKEGRIRFPGGGKENGERILWLIDHCASMDIKITKDKSGEPIRKFVKGSGPNDGLMALLNAYLAWKFDVTQGFKITNPLFMKYDVTRPRKNTQAVLGYFAR